jgi:hypothetical protein
MFSVVAAAHLLVLLRGWIFLCGELHQNPKVYAHLGSQSTSRFGQVNKLWNWVFNTVGEEAEKQVAQLGY